MEFSAQQIADFLHGKVVGNPEICVNDVSKIEEGRPGTLTFLSNQKYASYIYTTAASIVLVNDDFELEQPIQATLIRVKNAYESLAILLNLVEMSKPKKNGISSLAFISTNATIGENAYIGEFAYIGDSAVVGKNVQIYPQVYIGDHVVIGDDTILYPGVKIYEGCKVGSRCIFHAGVVIGADGFGFAPGSEGYAKIPQIGIVTIEDDVEIGANTTIDRSTMGTTLICKGVKLDNLIQVAHNVEIGDHTVMAAMTGVAGSTKIGKWCMMGGQCGIAGHLHIGDHCSFGAQTGVLSDVSENTVNMGTPSMPFKEFARCNSTYKKLPKLYDTVRQLQKEIEELKKTITK